jgi:uncharacterized protein YecE (DUF72 family)
MTRHGDIRIGISGWRYALWRGVFYPKDLPQRCELAYAGKIFSAVEINGTFYSLQRPESFARWAAETPPDFCFAVKGARYITHMLRLRNVAVPLANFFASGVLHLGPKLGPILWQLPPNFRFDPDRVEAFFRLLPRDTGAALSLARRHGPRLKGRSWLRTDARRPIRHALEIRHDSFVDPRFVALLRRHNVALVCADTVEWPRLMDVTADFVYCRLHGSEELYASGYSSHALSRWARRIVTWSTGGEVEDGRKAGKSAARRRARRDVYVFFDNDRKVRAPVDAQQLGRRVAATLKKEVVRA